MDMAAAEQGNVPLVPRTAQPNLSGKRLQAVFLLDGLATSILWNQLMLCVGTLTRRFGKSALATAAMSQNVLCAATMLFLVMLPRRVTLKPRLVVCGIGFVAMAILAVIFQVVFDQQEVAQEVFLAMVALTGMSTGITQNLAASISGSFIGAPRKLLLGESMSPLVAAGTSIGLRAFCHCCGITIIETTTLYASCLFLLLSVLALCSLWGATPTNPNLCDTIDNCITNTPATRQYKWRRVGETVGNSMVAMLACCTWVALLCSTPFLAEALCGSDSTCTSELPPVAISAANAAAALGRAVGLRCENGSRLWLLCESALLFVAGMYAIRACASGQVPLSGGVLPPFWFGVLLVTALTLWSNFVLMRNDHNAQHSSRHCPSLPSPVTTQIMWLAIQVGSIAGTYMSTALSSM